MSENISVGNRTGLRRSTRKPSKQMPKNDLSNPSSTDDWIFPWNKTEGESYVRKRIETYFKHFNNLDNHDALKDKWDKIQRHGHSSYPAMLAFAINDLKSQTVRFAPNYKTAIFAEKASYLEPFKFENETVWSTKPSKSAKIENPSIKKTGENTESTVLEDTPLQHYQKALFDACKPTNISPKYESTSKIVNGKTLWNTAVTHENDALNINFSGEASTKSASREQAAKNAFEHLKQNPLSAQKVQHNEISANIVEEEKEDELVGLVVTNDNINTNDQDTETEHFSEQQRAIIQKETKTTLEVCFQDFFDKAINSMTTKFDERIRNIVDEAYETSFKSTLQNEIHVQVQKQTSKIIQEAVKKEVESKVTNTMKEKVQNAVFDTISTRAQTECTQIFKNQFVLKVNNTIKESQLAIERKQLEAVETIQDETKASINSLNQLNIRDRSDINTRREQFSKHISKEFDTMMSKLETEANDHISNMNEVGDAIKDDLYATKPNHTLSEPDHIPSKQSMFNKHEEVCFHDTITGQECTAWVLDEHDDDMDNVFYTIRFANNNTIRTSQHNISKLNKPKHKLFPNVDADKIMSGNKSLHSVHRPSHQQHNSELDQPYTEPSAFDIKAFHQQFQSKITCDSDIITFYNQLKSQGKTYNIYLIDLNDIGPETDLCPTEISHNARETMSLAIYQKLQNENTRDFNYKHLENCMEQHADTSDGYYTLRELLRKVHPQLKVGKKILEIPRLSTCEYDLYTLSRQLKTYFKQQEIKGRLYSAKEKSETYLQQLDDERYKIAKTKCLIDLNLATMHGEHNIAQQSLTFEALPATVEDVAAIDDDVPVVHAMTKRSFKDKNPYERNYASGRKQQKGYEPLQCKGCGTWGHRVQRCQAIPKFALAMKFINKYPNETEALIKEFLRTNNKNVKRSTVRALQDSGVIDTDIDTLQYLQDNDIDIDMFDVDFDSPTDEI